MRIYLAIVAAAFGLAISIDVFAADIDDAIAAINNGNWDLGVRIAIPIADQGDPSAQSLVGAVLFSGKGNAAANPVRAFHYLRLSADNPESDDVSRANSLWLLSLAYNGGKGVRNDVEMALQAMWKSAQLGNQKAMDQLTESFCNVSKVANCYGVLKEKLASCEMPCWK